MACYCKLVAQNCHKNFNLVRVEIFLVVNPIAEIKYSMWLIKKTLCNP